eukprot:275687_1
MDTELAKQQELNTRNDQNILLNEVKEEEDNDLYLGNQKTQSKEIYEFNDRLLKLLPFTILTFISYFVYPMSDETRIIVIAYNGCGFLCCLLVIVYGYCIHKQSLQQYVNELFGIRFPADVKDADIFDFEERRYAGVWLLLAITYTTFVATFRATYETVTGSWSLLTVYTQLPAFVMNFLFLAYFYKTVECHQEIMRQKESLWTKYKNIQQIDDKIRQRIHKWRNAKRLTHRKLELAATCVVVCGVNVIYSTLGWGVWNVGVFNVVLIIIYLIDIVVFSSVLYSVRTLYLHYKLGSIIMGELGLPLNATSITDLIGWWKLRTFYANYVVTHYTSSLSLLTGVLLLGITCLSMALFFLIGSGYMREITMAVLWLSYMLFLTFLFVSNAVNYLGNQLSHSNMIIDESMALGTKHWKSNTQKDFTYQIEMQEKHYIIDQMVKNIERNSVAISVFGIKMNHTFMNLLKTATGSIVIAIVSSILRRQE